MKIDLKRRVLVATGLGGCLLLAAGVRVWQRNPAQSVLQEEPYRLVMTPGGSDEEVGRDVYYFFGDSAKIGKRLERELKGQLGWTREPFSSVQEAN